MARRRQEKGTEGGREQRSIERPEVMVGGEVVVGSSSSACSAVPPHHAGEERADGGRRSGVRDLPNRRPNMKRVLRHGHLLLSATSMSG